MRIQELSEIETPFYTVINPARRLSSKESHLQYYPPLLYMTSMTSSFDIYQPKPIHFFPAWYLMSLQNYKIPAHTHDPTVMAPRGWAHESNIFSNSVSTILNSQSPVITCWILLPFAFSMILRVLRYHKNHRESKPRFYSRPLPVSCNAGVASGHQGDAAVS